MTPYVQRFVLHIGEMGSRWGLNRTRGQMCGLLYGAPKPLDADEIAETLACHVTLKKLARTISEKEIDDREWMPFAFAASIFLLAFAGLAYSLFPYLLTDELTIWDAAAATNSLQFALWGVVITLPAILAYTVFAFRVFWGKTHELSYD